MISKSLILLKIKEYKKFKSNVEFAEFLGVSSQLISKWINRETFDIDVLYSKLPEISPDWLLTGQGEMLRADGSAPTVMGEPEQERKQEIKQLSTEIVELRDQERSNTYSVLRVEHVAAYQAKQEEEILNLKAEIREMRKKEMLLVEANTNLAAMLTAVQHRR